jgi:hypothetical protein
MKIATLLLGALLVVSCRGEPSPAVPPGRPSPSPAGLVSGLSLSSPARRIDRATAKRVARQVLTTPEAVELIRIPWGNHDEPERVQTGGFVHYAVESRGFAKYPESVGRTLDSFIGYTADDTSVLASCFTPHHGIVALAGANRVEALVCFECARMEIHVDGYDGALEWGMRDMMTEHDPATAFGHVFDALFDQSGLPKAVPGRAGPH